MTTKSLVPYNKEYVTVDSEVELINLTKFYENEGWFLNNSRFNHLKYSRTATLIKSISLDKYNTDNVFKVIRFQKYPDVNKVEEYSYDLFIQYLFELSKYRDYPSFIRYDQESLGFVRLRNDCGIKTVEYHHTVSNSKNKLISSLTSQEQQYYDQLINWCFGLKRNYSNVSRDHKYEEIMSNCY